MNKILKHILLILFVVLSITRQNTYAQAANNYPVDVTPILTPPYKLNIAEYASNSAFLKLQLRLKDLTKSSVDVYFKMQISTIGISIRTRDDFKPLKMEKLFPGELKTLTGPDLAEYFRPENLIVDGLDPAILYAGGKLPSGLYTFTFTAYEADRDRQVSNVGTALMTVFLGLPPLITSPQQDQLLTPTDPQAVLFQWLPRATAATTGFSSTVYQIRIFRIDPTNAAQTSLFVEANQTALSQDPIFVGQSNSPNFLYNPLQPAYFPLIPGEVYAIQVQATNPIANENTYENNGYSQVVSFRYGAKCLPPTAFTTSLKDLGIVTLSWQAAEAAQSYDVRYRLSGTSLWQSKSIYGNSITLPFLADGNYEYQLLSNCGVATQSSWGESQRFTLSNGLLIEAKPAAAKESAVATTSQTNSTSSTSQSTEANDLLDRVMNPLANPVSSGPALDQADIDSFFEKVPRPKCAGVADKTVSCDVNNASYTGTPKDLLQVGDKIVINNYEVLLSEVSGSAGTFSGRGIAQFPFLAVRFPVIFSNISVVGAPEGTDPLTQEMGGCVSAGEIAVEGSDASLLDRDVQTRLQNLYNRANNPNAFSGNFKEAIEAAKKMAQELLDKIAKGETPTAEEIGKYKNICKALNAGIEAWKQDIVKAIPAPVPAEITQLITDLDTYKGQLQDILNCSGQGYLKFGQKRDGLYASIILGKKELYFEPCLNADNIKKAGTVAQGLLDKINSSKPGDNEVNASSTENKTYKSCRDGKIAEIEFNDKNLQISLETTASVAFRIWNIADKKYLLWWGKGELVGFYKVGVKPGYLNGVIVPKPEVIDYKVLAYTTGECATVDGDYFDPSKKGDYFSDAGLNKLKDKLSAQGATNTEITVKDCTDPSKAPKTVTNSSITASAGQKGIQIEMCWDGSKWKLAHSFKAGTLKIASGFKGSIAEVEAKSNAVADRVKETGLKANSFEDELVYKELDVIQALVEVKEATITLCNEAKVPDKYWTDADSPIKAPTLSGVGDGAITELKDIPELVGFALQIATEPETAKGMWNGIKSLTPTKVKKMLLGAANDKLAKYGAGGNTMKHEAGKDGVAMAMFVFGGVKNIKDGADLIDVLGDDVVEKLDEIAEESLDILSSNVGDATGKLINKGIKESNIDAATVENSISDIVDKSKKWTFPELQALWKRGNDFNTKRAGDYRNNEVWVTHPTKTYPVGHKNAGQARRYRLDAYDHIDGYIVSRKATTLSEISESTFKKYLDELLDKYPEGSKIARSGIGAELKGKYRLEIPNINDSFPKLQEYKKLAADKGIELLTKAE